MASQSCATLCSPTSWRNAALILRIRSNSLHPEMVRTQLAEEANLLMKLFYTIAKPFMRSPTSDGVESVSGKYFRNTAPASIAYDDNLTTTLWQKGKELTGLS